MSTAPLASFHLIGISVRTTNENSKALQDIPALWQQFMSEGIAGQIPNKISDEIYCVYTDYEKDHTKPYTTILGCKVSSLEHLPENMKGMTFSTGNYEHFTAKGNLNEGVVYQSWLKIWESDLDRNFRADFEVYGAKAQNPADAEVDIFVGVVS